MRKKTYLKLVDYQTEQSEKHLNEVRSIHKEMRGYKHDFHHHLQTLKGQLEAGEIERALAYIEQLDTQLMQVDTLLKTRCHFICKDRTGKGRSYYGYRESQCARYPDNFRFGIEYCHWESA